MTPEPLPVELLATQYQRRLSDIDEDLDDLIEIDPYVSGTNSRRSDRDLAKMLDLIDNLPISENGKEGSI